MFGATPPRTPLPRKFTGNPRERGQPAPPCFPVKCGSPFPAFSGVSSRGSLDLPPASPPLPPHASSGPRESFRGAKPFTGTPPWFGPPFPLFSIVYRCTNLQTHVFSKVFQHRPFQNLGNDKNRTATSLRFPCFSTPTRHFP